MSSEDNAIDSNQPSPEGREPISAFVICFNEEENIARCLKSLQFCDELVVIDSFSTDRTVAIAESFGAKVLQRKWTGYREQKAFGLGAVRHEWVLNIDADECVSPLLRDSILAALRVQRASAPGVPNGYYLNRVVFHLGRWWRVGGWYPEYRLRLVRKSKTVWGGKEPHEKPIVDGPLGTLDGELAHYSYRGLDDQISRLHSFSTISAKEDYLSGRRPSLMKMVLNPVFRIFKFFVLKQGFREGAAGLIVAVNEGYYTFMKYAKLWELHFNESKKGRDRSGSPE